MIKSPTPADREVADCEITMWVDKVGKEEVQLTHGYIDVVRVDAESGMQTIRGLL